MKIIPSIALITLIASANVVQASPEPTEICALGETCTVKIYSRGTRRYEIPNLFPDKSTVCEFTNVSRTDTPDVIIHSTNSDMRAILLKPSQQGFTIGKYENIKPGGNLNIAFLHAGPNSKSQQIESTIVFQCQQH